MSADNIVVIKKEEDGKFRGYHRSMSAYSEGQYEEYGLCCSCLKNVKPDELDTVELKAFGARRADPNCEICRGEGFIKEEPIFETNSVEGAIYAYHKWYKEMEEEDDMGMFMVEYGCTFEGLNPGDAGRYAGSMGRYTDTELLDFLQEQTNKAVYTGRVVCRDSETGRGWRLHETRWSDAVPDVRQAITNYMKDLDFKVGVPHRFTMYAIGQEDEHGGLGMWDGPNPSSEEMLAVEGRDNNSVIVRFNRDGTDEIIYRWKDNDWVKIDHPQEKNPGSYMYDPEDMSELRAFVKRERKQKMNNQLPPIPFNIQDGNPEKITSILTGFLFEPNNKSTRDQIKNSVKSWLDQLVIEEKIFDPVVICDDTNNTEKAIFEGKLCVDYSYYPGYHTIEESEVVQVKARRIKSFRATIGLEGVDLIEFT